MELRIINIQEDTTKEIYASEECRQLISIYEGYYPKIGFHVPWVGYFVMRENKIVGSCGFTGLPKDGKVEIAYWTFKEYEGQGIASFCCKELISMAKQAGPDIIITAKTAPEQNASTKILQRNGFKFSGVVQDDEIGDAWHWELKAVE
jgi:RimJ/RimL family protein N-acetyltransferase